MRNLRLACSMLVLLGATACGSNDPVADAAPGAPDARIITKADAGIADAGSADATSLPPGGCRQQADCASNADICYGPNDTMCGIPPATECDDDSTCGKGRVCHSFPDSCSPDRVGSRCGFPCISFGGSACADGFACDATGHCRAEPCGDTGFACPISQTCDPTTIDANAPPHAQTHGCVTADCTTDATCPAATRCVNGYCQDGFGTCSPPVP